MPKKILVSTSGGYQEITASYDDNNALSASNIIINTGSFISQNGIMQIFNNKLIPIATSSIFFPDPGNNWSGSVLSYREGEGFGPHRRDTPSFTGDLSGTLTTTVKIKSVSNVTGGVLSSLYGGTSNNFYTTNSIVTTTGSGPVYGSSDQILAVTGANGEFGLVNKNILNFTPMTGTIVYLFTGSVGASNTNQFAYTFNNWSPPTGCRFIRVICQAGGGGGGAGWQSTLQANTYGGAGGGGGGYADVTFNALNLTFPINIIAGQGGAGGPSNTVNGNDGGESYFGPYLTSSRGGGGYSGANGGAAGGGGGTSYLTFGGAGGKGTTGTAGAVGVSVGSLTGAPGGGGAGGNITTANAVGYLGGGLSDLAGGTAGSTLNDSTKNGGNGNESYSLYFNSYYLNNTSSLITGGFPKLKCSGGGGGQGGGSSAGSVNGGNGGSATFGAGGGGGGGKNTTGNTGGAGAGGNGGKGYVLIICW